MPTDTSNTTQTTLTALLPRLRRRARRLCRTDADAEDLAQETVLRLLQMLAKPKTDLAEPARYAMITLHNLAKQGWRDRHPTEELSDDMAQAAPAAPARLACAEATAAIARLPDPQAEVMAQLLAGEQSPKEIARRMDMPLGTVMSRLARARARLRKELALEGSIVDLL